MTEPHSVVTMTFKGCIGSTRARPGMRATMLVSVHDSTSALAPGGATPKPICPAPPNALPVTVTSVSGMARGGITAVMVGRAPTVKVVEADPHGVATASVWPPGAATGTVKRKPLLAQLVAATGWPSKVTLTPAGGYAEASPPPRRLP